MNERIEKYYNKELTPEEQKSFEADLLLDPQLASDTAFYIQARQVIREEILDKRHAEWKSLSRPVRLRPKLTPWYYAAAAVLLVAVGIGWYFLTGSPTPDTRQMAAAYIEQNLTELPLQMEGQADSLQLAIDHYNFKRFPETKAIVESLLRTNPNNAEVLKLAGLAALRTQQYDQAIAYFQRLANQPDLFENPGKFYESLAYLQRNEPLDKITADSLLNVVITNNLDGKEEAERWLKKE